MPIPYRLNPMGKNEKKYFELVVKPGILTSTMSFWFIPYWNSGGYCKVDWGDGQKEDATKSGTKLNHTYAEAGTYTVKIKAECYRVNFSAESITIPIIAYCSGNWEELGYLTTGRCMFYNCVNMEFNCTSLPEGLTTQQSMFGNCKKATLPLTKLPDRLSTGHNMFIGCTNAELPLTKLPDSLTDGDGMFYGCTNAQLSLTKLPEGLTNGRSMFDGCTNAKITVTKLPDGITNGYRMFYNCPNVEINLDTLVANAPVEGWTKLTNITNMFYNCPKVTGSRSAFLAKCPPNPAGASSAFILTNTTE